MYRAQAFVMERGMDVNLRSCGDGGVEGDRMVHQFAGHGLIDQIRRIMALDIGAGPPGRSDNAEHEALAERDAEAVDRPETERPAGIEVEDREYVPQCRIGHPRRRRGQAGLEFVLHPGPVVAVIYDHPKRPDANLIDESEIENFEVGLQQERVDFRAGRSAGLVRHRIS